MLLAQFLLSGAWFWWQYLQYILDLLICVATELEASILRDRIGEFPRVGLVVTGVGPVNAAHAVTMAIIEAALRAPSWFAVLVAPIRHRA